MVLFGQFSELITMYILILTLVIQLSAVSRVEKGVSYTQIYVLLKYLQLSVCFILRLEKLTSQFQPKEKFAKFQLF